MKVGVISKIFIFIAAIFVAVLVMGLTVLTPILSGIAITLLIGYVIAKVVIYEIEGN